MSAELGELIKRYRRLKAMGGRQAQVRGQQFNVFLRDLLRAWGLEAHADQRGIRNRDETDVGFSIGRSYYILEAKWTAHPINLDPVAKLYLRLKVRPPGTAAVLVSMKGFTSHVREFTEYHPEIILLDDSHIEAMVAGLEDPADLLHSLFSWTSRRGGSYVPLHDLLLSPYPPDLPVWSAPTEQSRKDFEVLEAAEGVRTRLLVSTGPHPDPYTGGALAPDGRLLLTCSAGVQALDLASRTGSWELSLPGSHGPVGVDRDGHLLVVCSAAVARWNGSTLHPVAGGFRERSNLLSGRDGSHCVLTSEQTGGHTLTRLGTALGDEQHWPVEFPGRVSRAAITNAGELYLGSYQGGTLPIGPDMRLTADNWFLTPELSEITALQPAGEHTMLSAGRSRTGGTVSVYATDLRTQAHTRLLNMRGNHVIALVPEDRGHYYLVVSAFGATRSVVAQPGVLSMALPHDAVP